MKLSRKAGEGVMIGDGIEVTVTRIGSNRVEINVEAPDRRILRSELEAATGAVFHPVLDQTPSEAAS